MKIKECSIEPLLSPCSLERFNFQLDTYVGCEHYCHYCYVLRQAKTDWRNEVWIHRDLELRLESALEGLQPQPVYMGYHADPYQPCETELRQTGQALETLDKFGFSAGILTKSDLVLRDIESLRNMAESSVSVSVAFKDSHTLKLFEEKTPATERRIEALAELKNAGVRTGALLCPIIPYITESIDLLEDLAKCADRIWVYPLSVEDEDPKDQGWINTRRIIREHFPEKAAEIEQAILNKNHPYWHQLKAEIESFGKGRSLDLRIHI